MAIANLTEKLLFFTLQKSAINLQLDQIQMNQLSVTKSQAKANSDYNENLQNLYYDENVGYQANPDAYMQYLVEMQNEHELELSNLTSWESQLESQKDQLETQLSEIQNYESSFQNLLKNNIQKEFQYGGKSGG